MYSYDTNYFVNDLQEFLIAVSAISILISLAISILVTITCGIVAYRKNRSVVGWVFCGLFLGTVGLVIIALLSEKSDPYKTYTYKVYDNEKQTKSCPHCGEIVTSSVCPICNSRNDLFTNAPKISTKVNKKIELFKCDDCRKTITTSKCPYCGFDNKR